jgi:hypothetical protein
LNELSEESETSTFVGIPENSHLLLAVKPDRRRIEYGQEIQVISCDEVVRVHRIKTALVESEAWLFGYIGEDDLGVIELVRVV